MQIPTTTSTLDTYIALHLAAVAKAEAIRAALDDHQDGINPERLNWGHVGDLKRASEALDEAIAALDH